MPVFISTKRLTAGERFEQDSKRFIEQYCADHASFIADPQEYYRAQLHKKNPGAARGFGDDGTQERYFSPYDDEHRFRNYEAVGGYRCAPYGNDGVAVRAAQGFTQTANQSGAEGFKFVSGNRASSKPVLPQATQPSPVKTGGRWEYPDDSNFFRYAALYRFSTSRATRFAPMPVEPPLPQLPSPRRPEIATVKNISPSKAGLSPFIYGAVHVLYPHQELAKERRKARAKGARNHFAEFQAMRPSDFADYEPTDADIAQWRRTYWLTRRRFDCREGRLEPFCACDACQKWYPNLERVDWRTVWVWCEETNSGEDLSTRRMLDLNARLKLYRYGDHHFQPDAMCGVTAKRLYDARLRWVARGIRPYFWPKYELGTFYTEGAVKDKQRDGRMR